MTMIEYILFQNSIAMVFIWLTGIFASFGLAFYYKRIDYLWSIILASTMALLMCLSKFNILMQLSIFFFVGLTVLVLERETNH